MEVNSSVKRVNDSDLEEISSATQQKRVKRRLRHSGLTRTVGNHFRYASRLNLFHLVTRFS